MKKFLKNKILVLVICVIVVSGVYIAVQKAIGNYFFESNKDIVSDGGKISEDEVNLKLEGGDGSENEKHGEDTLQGDVGSDLGEEGENIVSEETVEREDGGGGKDAGESEEVEDWSDVEEGEGITDGENLKKIYIYITGEVNIPGVVILNEGSRIVDAINAAGGTTTNADITKVNLVYVLSDGMKVNIPSSSDLKDNHSFEYITMNSGDESKDDFVADEGNSDYESSNGIESSASNDSGNGKKYSIVNINTATQTELESLPGIGPSLALNIINYRKQNGKFSSIEDIKNVSGIGDAKFENLKKYIRV